MKKYISDFYYIFLPILVLSAILVVTPNKLPAQGQPVQERSRLENTFGNHQADRWYFGKFAGLDFRLQDPVADLTNDSINAITSPALIADKEGNILFSSDGHIVLNRLNHKMPHGDNLHGFPGMTMPVLIIPKPGNDSIYYIFTLYRPLMDPNDPATIYGLEYSEVDMGLDSGLGDITFKNKVLLEPDVSSKLTAVKHSNGTDYWVVAHRFDSDEFCSFLITSDGVDTSHYISSHTGSVHVGPGITNNEVGYMKISPDGTKLALAILGSDIYEIFDFNASTGEVTNAITSAPVFDEAYGIEFSPDSRYLYGTITSVSMPSPFDTPVSRLYQFDISLGNLIFNSFDTIAIDTQGSYFGGMQLGTDGKIYIARSPYGNSSLSVIQNPKRPGAECNFMANALDLLGRTCRYGFPNFIQSYFDLPHVEAENACANNATIFSLQNNSNVDHVFWNFGDPGSGSNTSTDFQPVHIYKEPGTYQVQLTESYNDVIYDTYTELITIYGSPYFDLVDTIYMSPGSPVILDAGEGFVSYEWSTGENTQTIQVDEPGIYSVTVYNEGYCSSADSVVVSYYSLINEGNENGPICLIYPNPGNGAVKLMFPSGTNHADISVFNQIGQTLWGPDRFNDIAINGEVVFNLDELAEGLYFIQVKVDDQGTFSTKYFKTE